MNGSLSDRKDGGWGRVRFQAKVSGKYQGINQKLTSDDKTRTKTISGRGTILAPKD